MARAKVVFKKRPQEPVVGPAGKDGVDGVDGIDGRDGIDGKDGAIGPRGFRGEAGPKGRDGADGPQGKRGPRGPKGDKGDPGKDGRDGERGPPGKDGAQGLSEYDLWLQDGNKGTLREFLKSRVVRDNPRVLGMLGGSGGGGRAAVSELRNEIEAAAAPKSATLTRDGNGAVETVTVEGEATWTLSRNPDESVSSLDNGTYNVAVDRDGNGAVTGITVT